MPGRQTHHRGLFNVPIFYTLLGKSASKNPIRKRNSRKLPKTVSVLYNVVMDATMGKVGGRVREMRKARRWSQQRLGDESGVSAQTVWHLETGRHVPETATLLKVASGLGVSLADLLG